MSKSMISSFPVLLCLFFFTETAIKKRKFDDILEQSLSQTHLCPIFKIPRLVYN